MNEQKPIESMNDDVTKKKTSGELAENDLKQVAGGEELKITKEVDKASPKL